MVAKMMTVKDAAKMTGLKQATLRDLSDNGFFVEDQSVGDGKMLILSDSELAALFADMLNREVEAEADTKEQSAGADDEGPDDE